MLNAKWVNGFKSLFVMATVATSMGFAAAALAQSQSPSGGTRDVVTLNPPQVVENDGKVEVLEFFGYGCIHCANLEPRLEAWSKKLPADVKLKRVPVSFAIRGLDSIPLFYTLEAMGLQEKLHQKIFDAANVENVILGNPATLNSWLEKQGVDTKKFEQMQKSFSVQNKIARAKKMTEDYKIQATPTLIVNGRFSIQQTAGPDKLFANIDQLIAEARVANKSSASPVVTKK
jgi:thiol:disulfide interchange protein DsbA